MCEPFQLRFRKKNKKKEEISPKLQIGSNLNRAHYFKQNDVDTMIQVDMVLTFKENVTVQKYSGVTKKNNLLITLRFLCDTSQITRTATTQTDPDMIGQV